MVTFHVTPTARSDPGRTRFVERVLQAAREAERAGVRTGDGAWQSEARKLVKS